MLDTSLDWFRVILKREQGTPLPQASLPSGYSIVTFQSGDEEAWGEIEASVLEFADKDAATEYFANNYLPYKDELARRTMFIQAHDGEKVATFTAWWNYTGVRRHPFVHWVAVKPPFQGQGLGKAIIAAGVKHMIDIEGDRLMYIPTSTWAHKAIRLYRWAGFEVERHEPAPGGFENQTAQALQVLKERMLI
ncbi:GNAT family N-acetyltransferase [Paenibacillus kobensis]|uniref:GNAT family N-acetyltransferase n=1 Tax=Paenibacillus kobensis TaxID=59841 RepID=UPI000FDC6F39|nr:GNAT family N-acetyltransferase [Paenibacillus kobensis]